VEQFWLCNVLYYVVIHHVPIKVCPLVSAITLSTFDWYRQNFVEMYIVNLQHSIMCRFLSVYIHISCIIAVFCKIKACNIAFPVSLCLYFYRAKSNIVSSILVFAIQNATMMLMQCCKNDKIWGVRTPKPWTDRHKIWHGWYYVRDIYPACQNSKQLPQYGRVPANRWHITLACMLFSFFLFIIFYSPASGRQIKY